LVFLVATVFVEREGFLRSGAGKEKRKAKRLNGAKAKAAHRKSLAAATEEVKEFIVP
jgi:hypothetical protein